jgi:hypothetical protein
MSVYVSRQLSMNSPQRSDRTPTVKTRWTTPLDRRTQQCPRARPRSVARHRGGRRAIPRGTPRLTHPRVAKRLMNSHDTISGTHRPPAPCSAGTTPPRTRDSCQRPDDRGEPRLSHRLDQRVGTPATTSSGTPFRAPTEQSHSVPAHHPKRRGLPTYLHFPRMRDSPSRACCRHARGVPRRRRRACCW